LFSKVRVTGRGHNPWAVTRPAAEFDLVRDLIRLGLSDLSIFRRTGVPRRTVYDWRMKGRQSLGDGECPQCGGAKLDASAYSYLLGLYLGDGVLTRKNRRVFRLRFFLDDRYPQIQTECARNIQAVRLRGAAVYWSPRRGCTEISADWNHWICLFPQHGPGMKHQRSIKLQPWQLEIVARFPGPLLRGLLQSDGCRYQSRNGPRVAARYQFTNHSQEILEIFSLACRLYGISCTTSGTKASVSRQQDVAKLDKDVGPKR
jgi:hypothetical protein